MKLYTILIHDKSKDPVVHVIVDPIKAVAMAKKIAKEKAAEACSVVTEENFGGYLYNAHWDNWESEVDVQETTLIE